MGKQSREHFHHFSQESEIKMRPRKKLKESTESSAIPAKLSQRILQLAREQQDEVKLTEDKVESGSVYGSYIDDKVTIDKFKGPTHWKGKMENKILMTKGTIKRRQSTTKKW